MNRVLVVFASFDEVAHMLGQFFARTSWQPSTSAGFAGAMEFAAGLRLRRAA